MKLRFWLKLIVAVVALFILVVLFTRSFGVQVRLPLILLVFLLGEIVADVKKEILISAAASGILICGLVLGFGGSGNGDGTDVTTVNDVGLTENAPPPPPPPPPPAAVKGGDQDQPVSDVLLPDDLLSPGLNEPPASSVAIDVLSQYVKPEAPRPPRPDSMVTVGIPTGAQRAGAAGAKANVIFSLDELDRVPEARFKASPIYPFDMRSAGIEGSVVMILFVDPNGRVIDVSVVKATNAGFINAAVEAARKWRFEPGVRKGAPVSFKMSLPMTFSINK
ncbi:MAG: energy transducer TonB [Opitutales bacterium]|jgi:protein TonB